MIDLTALKEQLKLLGHDLADDQVTAILKDMNIEFSAGSGQESEPPSQPHGIAATAAGSFSMPANDVPQSSQGFQMDAWTQSREAMYRGSTGPAGSRQPGQPLGLNAAPSVQYNLQQQTVATGNRRSVPDDDDMVLTRLSTEVSDADFLRACAQPVTLMDPTTAPPPAWQSAASISTSAPRPASSQLLKPPASSTAVPRAPHEWYGKQDPAPGPSSFPKSYATSVSVSKDTSWEDEDPAPRHLRGEASGASGSSFSTLLSAASRHKPTVMPWGDPCDNLASSRRTTMTSSGGQEEQDADEDEDEDEDDISSALDKAGLSKLSALYNTRPASSSAPAWQDQAAAAGRPRTGWLDDVHEEEEEEEQEEVHRADQRAHVPPRQPAHTGARLTQQNVAKAAATMAAVASATNEHLHYTGSRQLHSEPRVIRPQKYKWHEDLRSSSPPASSVLSLQPSTTSLISRASSKPGAAKKVDRVARYNQLQQAWKKDKFLQTTKTEGGYTTGKKPVASTRKPLNFNQYFAALHAAEEAKKSMMLRQARAQTQADLKPGSQYTAPTSKRRDALRWETRLRLKNQE